MDEALERRFALGRGFGANTSQGLLERRGLLGSAAMTFEDLGVDLVERPKHDRKLNRSGENGGRDGTKHTQKAAETLLAVRVFGVSHPLKTVDRGDFFLKDSRIPRQLLV